jgi:hypothetical protein
METDHGAPRFVGIVVLSDTITDAVIPPVKSEGPPAWQVPEHTAALEKRLR